MGKPVLKRILWILLAAAVIAGAVIWDTQRPAPVRSEPEETPAPTAEPREAAPVRISEIVASNETHPADDGEYYDCVELYNPTGRDADISGWGLSDRDDQVKYRFPDGTVVPAGGYYVVWCSKTLDRSDLAYFGVSVNGGDSVCLFAPDAYLEESVPVPATGKGLSYSRFADGTWAVTLTPTPGEDNIFTDPADPYDPLLDTCRVRFSELMASNNITLRDSDGEYSDWVELVNEGDSAFDLSGWFLSDNIEKPRKWTIPYLTLGPGERTIIFCSGKDRSDGELHTSFSLSKDGGGLFLYTPMGVRADAVEYGPLEKEQVYRRTESGEEVSYEATPMYANSSQGLEEYIAAADVHGEVVINEVVPYNTGIIKDARGVIYDWIELRNTSNHTVNLKGFTLSNDPEQPDKCKLPDYALKPNAYYIVFCSDSISRKDGVHGYANFNISTQGEFLYLYDASGNLSDSVYVHDTIYGGSVGRDRKGTGFYLFEKPTPSKINGTGYRRKSGPVTADIASGIYNDVTGVTVSLSGKGAIYYTTNGSEPTRAAGKLYTGPITLKKTTVIRARCYDGYDAGGDIASFSYIINEHHTMPVLSMVCNPKTFRSLINSGQRTFEIDGEISLYSEKGTEFSSGCSIRLHGNSSRALHNKKMFVVEFNNRFGGNLNYDVFGDGVITEFSSLMLRGETAGYMYILRDSVAALVANRVTDTQLALNNRYAVMYVNGQYYGLYPIREDYSKQYIASHTGSTLESCVAVRPPVRETQPNGLYKIIDRTCKSNMAEDANYEWACQHWDMVNIADWMLLEGYFNNTDVGGNVRYIYGDNTDGKWRLAYYDFDIALLNKTPNFGETVYGGNQINSIMQSFLKSPKFRKLVAERCVILLDNGLADNIALQVINECAAEVEPEIDRDTKRWHPSTEWKSGLRSTRSFFSDDRTKLFIDAVSRLLRLSSAEKAEYFGRFLEKKTP